MVPQDLVTVLEASDLVWSALAHTVDSNSVEGRLCTLNCKRIPPTGVHGSASRQTPLDDSPRPDITYTSSNP